MGANQRVWSKLLDIYSQFSYNLQKERGHNQKTIDLTNPYFIIKQFMGRVLKPCTWPSFGEEKTYMTNDYMSKGQILSDNEKNIV